MTQVSPKATHPRIDTCPSCGCTDLSPFYDVRDVPVHSCLMLDDHQEAERFPRDDLSLSVCERCEFIMNTRFSPAWSAYAPNYEDQQSFSPTFNSFAQALASGLVERYALKNKRIIEVGCSKGDFLALLCEAGDNSGIGIDPSATPERNPSKGNGRLHFINAYYSAEHTDLAADFLCCRHTLEHVQPVRDFVGLFRRAVASNPGSPVMIEVPDTARVLREAAFEDLYYEHCSYFTPGTLASLLRRAGFAIYDLRLEYDDQYIVAECGDDTARDRHFEIERGPGHVRTLVGTFTEKVGAVNRSHAARIAAAARRGGSVAIWGSGSKCVSFMSTLGIQSQISCIVDINPNRHGKYIPGSAHVVQPPSLLAEVKPDLVIVMNPIYEKEICAMINDLGVKSQVVPLHALGEVADA